MSRFSGCNRELVAAINTFIQVASLTSLTVSCKVHNAVRFATDAKQAVWKADIFKVFNALFFRIELLEMLENTPEDDNGVGTSTGPAISNAITLTPGVVTVAQLAEGVVKDEPPSGEQIARPE